MNKQYTLEEIMAAWAKYKMPIYYYNGKEVSEKKYKGILGNEKIITDSKTFLKIYDRYEMGISFPEYFIEHIEERSKIYDVYQ